MASSQHPDERATVSATRANGDTAIPDNVTNIAHARRRVKKNTDKAAHDNKSSKQKVRSTPNRNFDHEKVARIKAAIANGSYKIDPDRIADKFIEKESP